MMLMLRILISGGSNIPPETAAQLWLQQVEPLAKLGVKLGAPAATGAPAGLQWTKNFLTACINCTIDFIPVHVGNLPNPLIFPVIMLKFQLLTVGQWYGDFQGLASHIGEYVGTFNKTIWVTEYADSNVNIHESQTFYNQSSSYLDRTE